MRRGRTLMLLLATMMPSLPSTASATVILPSESLVSATSGIALGPDGNLWAAEEFANTVVRVSQAGTTVLPRFTLASAPRDITAGPRGTIWVTVPAARQIVWFDAASPAPTAHVITIGAAGTCGPSAITDGGNGKIYFSTETSGCAPNPGRIGSVDAASKTVDAASTAGAGAVFDLVASNGKLFAPDFDGDAVRRYSLGTPAVLESTVAAAGNPDGITATSDGTIWVTLWSGASVARFPATQSGGAAMISSPPSGFTNPFGIAPTPYGGVFVAVKGAGKLARFAADGTFAEFISTGLSNVEPFGLVAVPDGAWATDQQTGRIIHLVDGLPTAATVAATTTGATTATLTGNVSTGGNDAQVSFEYGLTTAYGSSSAPTAVAASAAGAGPVGAFLTGLTPATTYHVRARTTTSRGTAVGADVTFTTAAAPPSPAPGATPAPSPTPLPPVAAKTTVTSTTKRSSTTITSLTVKGLVGGETIKIACAAKKKGLCPFKSKTETKVKKGKKGTRSLTKYFGKKHPVKAGATVTVVISAEGKTPSTLTLTIRKGKSPKKVSS